MKVFSTIVKLILLSAVMTVATTSCDSDIDPVYVLSGDSMELMGGARMKLFLRQTIRRLWH